MTRALLILVFCASSAYAQTGSGVVGEVRVHGNHTTPDDKVMAIIGEVVGKPATDALVAEVIKKLDRKSVV